MIFQRQFDRIVTVQNVIFFQKLKDPRHKSPRKTNAHVRSVNIFFTIDGFEKCWIYPNISDLKLKLVGV